MQKKHFRILVAAACLCAGLSFSAYGEETISSVPLSFSWDGAPKGGEAVGTLTATTTSQSFIVEGSEYLKDDDTWDYGEWPCAEIELSAAEGYRFSTPNRRTFSLSGCNVQYKSSEIDGDGSTLILQVYLSRIGGQLPKITDLSWSGKNAVWDNIEGCDGYEVCLKKDGKTLVTVTSKGFSCCSIRHRTRTVNVKTCQVQGRRVNLLQVDSDGLAIVRANLNFHGTVFCQHVHAVELGLTGYAINFVQTGFNFVLDRVQVRLGVGTGGCLNGQFTHTL